MSRLVGHGITNFERLNIARVKEMWIGVTIGIQDTVDRDLSQEQASTKDKL